MTDQPQPRYAPGLADGHADGRLVAPSATRNEQPIIDALRPLLRGRSGRVLEIGSGTGQHAAAWAQAFPALEWLPSDPFETHLDSVRAWMAHAAVPNIAEPIWLDAAETWPDLGALTGVISCNVIHITPWVVAQGIIRGAGATVAPGGLLMFYGPFKEGGVHTGDGNAKFDASLQAQDPDWGIRDIEAVIEEAEQYGFRYPEIVWMPANNRLLALTRA